MVVLLGMLAVSERVETKKTMRPHSLVWTLVWVVTQKVVEITSRGTFLPFMEILFQPFDCTRHSDGTWTLDAAPERTCWDSPGHWIHAAVALLVIGAYFILSMRVLTSGGALSNIEFHPMRFWRRSEDRFQPLHVHPLSPARVQCVCTRDVVPPARPLLVAPTNRHGWLRGGGALAAGTALLPCT